MEVDADADDDDDDDGRGAQVGASAPPSAAGRGAKSVGAALPAHVASVLEEAEAAAAATAAVGKSAHESAYDSDSEDDGVAPIFSEDTSRKLSRKERRAALGKAKGRAGQAGPAADDEDECVAPALSLSLSLTFCSLFDDLIAQGHPCRAYVHGRFALALVHSRGHVSPCLQSAATARNHVEVIMRADCAIVGHAQLASPRIRHY
jgi:hypothetical protein